jgi:hypothetical protein
MWDFVSLKPARSPGERTCVSSINNSIFADELGGLSLISALFGGSRENDSRQHIDR